MWPAPCVAAEGFGARDLGLAGTVGEGAFAGDCFAAAFFAGALVDDCFVEVFFACLATRRVSYPGSGNACGIKTSQIDAHWPARSAKLRRPIFRRFNRGGGVGDGAERARLQRNRPVVGSVRNFRDRIPDTAGCQVRSSDSWRSDSTGRNSRAVRPRPVRVLDWKTRSQAAPRLTL